MTDVKVLALRSDVLIAPDQIDVAVIELVMLWPDEKARTNVSDQSAAFLFLTIADDDNSSNDGSIVSESAREIAKRRMFSGFNDEWEDRMLRGTIAGRLLIESIGLSLLAPELANFSRIKKAIAERFRIDRGIRMTEKTIDNTVWRTFRPVAAYWAAWIYCGGGQPFPCQPDRLKEFLATAESFRRRAESIHLAQSPRETILLPGETIRIPPEIHLPEFELDLKLRSSGKDHATQ